ncbi:PREDICTED: U-box domain-containing protein 9-like [Ipomoea nil]|uniref:U-box domain-containing protein 9-like n=1 Tax=Ipomoea nil TaxID=35883 RepID=UPI0009013BE0|nr:PREDICTED: U-box domain-containing protein 9-like [Ipomoea nil]
MARTSMEGGLVEEKAAELKKELQRAVKAIVDEEDDGGDCSVGSTNRAMQCLCALRDLKLKPLGCSDSLGIGNLSLGFFPPKEFLCPLSGELMNDPVVLSSGQTYDRPFIEKWLKDGNQTCPQTQQILSNMVLLPNHLARKLISKWCEEHGVELQFSPQIEDERAILKADSGYLNALLKKLSSSSVSDQKEAAKELRLLTKRMPSVRALFGDISDSITQLLYPLLSGAANSHPDLQEDLVTTVLNISILDGNKKLVGENPVVIPLLIESLKSGNIETRTNVAATLFTLSALDSNKYIIANSGALNPLIKLLDEGHPMAIKDAASAIFTICIAHENRGRAVSEGAVRAIMKKIKEHVLIDELLAILAMLSSHHKAVEEMGELGAVSCLLGLMRENANEHNKENCIATVYTLCFTDRTKLREVWAEEHANGTISRLAKSGTSTSRAKRKASGILERLDRTAFFAHTA